MNINQKAIDDNIFDNTELEAVECNKGKSLSNQLGRNKRLNS